jgi:hypothetical protein
MLLWLKGIYDSGYGMLAKKLAALGFRGSRVQRFNGWILNTRLVPFKP